MGIFTLIYESIFGYWNVGFRDWNVKIYKNWNFGIWEPMETNNNHLNRVNLEYVKLGIWILEYVNIGTWILEYVNEGM